jgi:hypothetical protein
LFTLIVANPDSSGMFAALRVNNLDDMTLMLMSQMIRREPRFTEGLSF